MFHFGPSTSTMILWRYIRHLTWNFCKLFWTVNKPILEGVVTGATFLIRSNYGHEIVLFCKTNKLEDLEYASEANYNLCEVGEGPENASSYDVNQSKVYLKLYCRWK